MANGHNSDDSQDKSHPLAGCKVPGSPGISRAISRRWPAGCRRFDVDGVGMIATEAVLCSSCMTPCALDGDEIPEDGLCSFCRGGETPGAPRASLLWRHRTSHWPPAGVPRELLHESKVIR